MALAEIAVRVLGLSIGARTESLSPYGPRYLPNSPFVLAEEGNVVRGRINNVGFRDRPFVFDLPDSVRRIGFFGDSYVEARQVEADSTFVNVFEDRANASGWRVDAAAFGIIGSGADQELFRFLQARREARFDEVVYVFCRNDFLDGFIEKDKPASWPFLKRDSLGAYSFSGEYQEDRVHRGKAAIKELLADLHFPGFLAYRLSVYKTARQVRAGWLPITGDAAVMTLFQLGDGAPAEHQAALEHWKEVVRFWKRACDADGMAFRILYIPWPEEVDDSLHAASGRDSLPRWGVSSWVGAFCASEGIPFHDPSQHFRAITGGRGKSLYWVHLNYEGHRALGDFFLRDRRAQVGPPGPGGPPEPAAAPERSLDGSAPGRG